MFCILFLVYLGFVVGLGSGWSGGLRMVFVYTSCLRKWVPLFSSFYLFSFAVHSFPPWDGGSLTMKSVEKSARGRDGTSSGGAIHRARGVWPVALTAIALVTRRYFWMYTPIPSQ